MSEIHNRTSVRTVGTSNRPGRSVALTALIRFGLGIVGLTLFLCSSPQKAAQRGAE